MRKHGFLFWYFPKKKSWAAVPTHNDINIGMAEHYSNNAIYDWSWMIYPEIVHTTETHGDISCIFACHLSIFWLYYIMR